MVVDQVLTDGEVDRIFQALADSTRRDIVRRTLTVDVSVSELAQAYAMSFAAVQKHVQVLERAGLVDKIPHGRQRLVHANPRTIAQVRELLAIYEETWRSRIARLDAVLADDGDTAPAPRSGHGERAHDLRHTW